MGPNWDFLMRVTLRRQKAKRPQNAGETARYGLLREWGCWDSNPEPTDYEPVVELTERASTPTTCDDGSVLIAPMVALQSPENACERVRTRDDPSDARDSLPPDLARLVAAWPMLPPDVKAKISAIVRQAEDCRRSCKMAAQEAGNHQGSSPLKSDEPAC